MSPRSLRSASRAESDSDTHSDVRSDDGDRTLVPNNPQLADDNTEDSGAPMTDVPSQPVSTDIVKSICASIEQQVTGIVDKVWKAKVSPVVSDGRPPEHIPIPTQTSQQTLDPQENSQISINQLAEQMESLKRMFESVLNSQQRPEDVSSPADISRSSSREPGQPPLLGESHQATFSSVPENVALLQARKQDLASPFGRPNEPVWAPAVINQINPPTYNGERSKARTWLKEYTTTMDINGYSDQQKLIRAPAYMTGDARCWYSATSQLHPEMDWSSFKKRFYVQFCGADHHAELSAKLDATKQRAEEHPSMFLSRIIDLCFQFDSNMTEQEMLRRISRGLHHTIAQQLYVAKCDESEWTIDWLTKVFSKFHSTERRPSVPSETSQNRRKTDSTSSSQGKKPRDLSNWTCVNCDQKGHTIQNCSQPRNEERIKKGLEAIRLRKQQQKDTTATPATSVNRMEKPIASKSRPQTSGTPKNQEQTRLPCDELPKTSITAKINGLEMNGRLDTGADMTIILNDVVEKLKLPILPWNQPPLIVANGSELTPLGMVTVLVTYDGLDKPLLAAVVQKTGNNQHLWGDDFFQTFNLGKKLVTHSKQLISTSPDVGERQTNTVTSAIEQQHPIDKVEFGNINEDAKKLFEETLIKHSDTFSRNEQDIGRTSTIKHRIILTDDKPVHKPPYRIPFRNRDEMEQTLNKLIATGAIRESKSPFASPVFFVGKDHGKSKRLVADYRHLNAITVVDRTPMPHPEDVFGLLSGMKIFAKLDITSMFNQIEVDERDIEKTAIITPFGLYECPLMSFGLVNAPATAVKLMKEVLRDLNGKTCYVYFDDIIIFAEDLPQLVQRCTSVLERLKEHNLKLKPSKCIFGVESVHFLGHVISARGIEIDPRRIQDVKNFPTPKNPSDVRSFHGLCSYNRKFIQGFADIAKPLTHLMGKPTDFKWTPEAQSAFEQLRDALIKAPILVHFNPEADHELRTDASSYAIGAVLWQKYLDPHQTGPVLYYSKTLTSAQRNYSATERELHAAYKAITELQHYLYGKKFTLVTDHAALSLLRNHKDPHQRLARCVAKLQGYEFDVVYKKGSNHLDADCMSRLVNDIAPREPCLDVEQAMGIVRTISSINSQGNEQEQPLEEVPEIDTFAEQRDDPFCKRYISILESETITPSEKAKKARNFVIQEDGLLYRVKNDVLFLLCVPEKRRSAILLSCHDVPIAGHLGFSRSYGLASSRYYWPKMRRDIKSHVASCNQCQRRKISNTRRQGYAQPLPIAEDVFDTIGIDLITKLPKSRTGHNTILVCTDNLSKYVIAVPLKNEKADTIISALFNQLIAKHGCPKVVISDRGTNLIGQKSSDFFRLFGIKRQLTSAYHPQSNGQTERFNRTLAVSLTMYVHNNQKDWSDFVPALAFAYNISVHSITQVTPYELVFNRKPRLPIDNLMNRNEFVNPSNLQPNAVSDAAKMLMRRLISENQQANKRRLDARRSAPRFNEGDLVVVERPTRIKGGAHKLSYTYVGPYKIMQKISDITFKIAPINNPSKLAVLNSYILRKFIPRTSNVADEFVDPNFIPREPYDQQVDDDSDAESIHTDDADEGADDGPPILSAVSEDLVGRPLSIGSDEEEPSPPFSPIVSSELFQATSP